MKKAFFSSHPFKGYTSMQVPARWPYI